MKKREEKKRNDVPEESVPRPWEYPLRPSGGNLNPSAEPPLSGSVKSGAQEKAIRFSAESENPLLEIKSYYKKTLAHFYFPDISEEYALRKLRGWIQYNPALHRELYDGPEGQNDQSFSRRQVKVLIKYLGEP